MVSRAQKKIAARTWHIYFGGLKQLQKYSAKLENAIPKLYISIEYHCIGTSYVELIWQDAVKYDAVKAFVARHTSAKNFTVVAQIPASVPAATDAATPAVNVTGRFRRYDGWVFRDRCREAIEAKTLDQHLFDAWRVAHNRRRANIKTKGRWPTISSTRARIEQAEQQAYETLLAALPQQDRIEATVTQGLGVATVGLRVGCDTNERIRRLEGLEGMHTVTVQGQTVSGSSPSVIATQTESAIVALKQQRKAAKEAMKAEVAKTKAEAATAKAQAKARAMATKAEGTRRPINNILKQLISKGDVTPTMLLAAATVIAADTSDQQKPTIGTIALTDNNQTLLQAGVKQDSTQQLHKCNKDIGNDPVDSRMEKPN